MSEDNDKTAMVTTPDVDPDATLVSPQDDSTVVRAKSKDLTTAAGGPPEPPPKAAAPKKLVGVGSVINKRFVIDKLLGRGGMGVVYRALDKRKQEAKDRHPFVAIKILGDEFRRHPVAFVALQREARKSQELAHPNIITVYDFDRDGDVVYMTMEELSGKPLDKYIRENPTGVPQKQAEKIIKAIAQGLAYAHSKNIVHSDLKPGNVFVTEDGKVKVLDFGIARAVSNIGEGKSGDKTLFDAGQLGGLTPSYASVEMFFGKEPHPSDDIYALGLMSYELFTGEHPFQRQRASDVLARGGKPAKIRNIPGHQWRTIAAALELTREKRLADAAIFLKKYEGISKAVINLAAALVVTIITLGSIALLRSPDSGPEVPFENLTPRLQAKVTEALTYGGEALKFGDVNGALIHFNEAYELHPRNKKAVAGLEEIVDRVVNAKIDKSNPEALQEFKAKIDIMLAYSALAENDKLLAARDKVTGDLNR